MFILFYGQIKAVVFYRTHQKIEQESCRTLASQEHELSQLKQDLQVPVTPSWQLRDLHDDYSTIGDRSVKILHYKNQSVKNWGICCEEQTQL